MTSPLETSSGSLMRVPAVSVLTTGALNDPAFVVNVTGTAERGLPDASKTLAVIVVVPPLDGTEVGLAVRFTAAGGSRTDRQFEWL